MSIKPIDLQVNIGQLPEIARGEHGRSTAVIEGQHVLEKDAGDHARSIKDKLDENKMAEKTIILREDGFQKNKKKKSGKEHANGSAGKNSNSSKDEKKGTMIDLKR
jgi:hypothetical protein